MNKRVKTVHMKHTQRDRREAETEMNRPGWPASAAANGGLGWPGSGGH